MVKFKVGDRVRLVGQGWATRALNEVGTILSVEKFFIKIRTDAGFEAWAQGALHAGGADIELLKQGIINEFYEETL